MPANAVVDQTSGVDSLAVSLVPYFAIGVGENYKAGPLWTCERIDYAIGAEPSSAMIKIPLATGLDERAPTVAMVVGGPLDTLKIGFTGIVRAINASGTSSDVFRGFITKISHEFDQGTDYALMQLSDARWLLQGVPIVGSYWGPGSTPWYRPGWAAIPNQYGEPNAIFSEGSDCFVFCEPRYGLSDGQDPPQSHEFSTAQACYWEPWMVAAHLRYLVSTATRTTFGEAGRLPEGIIWPEGLAATLDVDNSPRAKDESLLGKNLASTLHDLCEQVGGYGLTIEFSSEAQPTIAFVPTRYNDDDSQGQINIQRPVSGADLGLPDAAVQGSMVEDGTQLYTRLSVAGAYVMVERRASTSGSMGLIPAWTTDDKAALSGFIDTQLKAGKKPEDAFRNAFSTYPDVFAAWKVDPAWNFDSGITEVESTDRAQVSRPVLGNLLSSYLEDDNADSQTASRRPVMFEYLFDGGSDTADWLVAPLGELQIDARGIIRCPTLRDTFVTKSLGFRGPSFSAKMSAIPAGGLSSITGNTLRVTLAIPHDYRTAYTVRHPSDANEDAVPYEQLDADRVAIHTGRHAYLSAGHEAEYDESSGTFRQEWRYGSYPVPASAQGPEAGSATTPYRDDTSDLSKAAYRRAQKYMRLRRGGKVTFPRLTTSWRLGQSINGIEYNGGVWPIRSVVTSIAWNNSPGRQYTILGFGD